MRRIDLTDGYLLGILALLSFVERTHSPRLRDLIAECAANAAYGLSFKKRKQTDARLCETLGMRAPPGMTRNTFRVFWQDIFELAAASDTTRPFASRGLEHLEGALERGHGAILLESSHFGQRNLAKRLLHAHGIAIFQTHAHGHVGGFWKHHDTTLGERIVRPAFERHEKQFVAEVIHLPRDDSLAFTRRLMHILQSNGVLCVSGEGRLGRRHTAVSFLGRARAFATGMISLAKLTGAPILPLFCWQDKKGQTQLVIESPLDLTAGMSAYAAQLEAYILRFPEHYRGWHLL